MNTVLRWVVLAFVAISAAGCANVKSPFKSFADPTEKVARDAGFAFYPEADIRIEKRLFYERAKNHLAKAGYRLVDPDRADYLIRLLVTVQKVNSVDIYVPYVPRGLTGAGTPLNEGESTFHFIVYPAAAAKRSGVPSVWEATVVSTQPEFRLHEEEFVFQVFSRLGETYDGHIVFPRKT